MQGEDIGWSGRGRVRGRSARVQRGGEPAGVQLPRRRPGVQVRLPSAVLDWARQAIARRRRPVLVSSSRREGKTQINNNSTSRRSGREESFWPAPEWRMSRRGDAMQDRRRALWKEGNNGRATRAGQGPGCDSREASGGVRCPRCRADGWCVVGAEPERTLAGQR